MIALNDLARRHEPLRAELDAAFARVVGRGRYLSGDETAAFERAFAGYCGVRECVAVANGTDALELALRAAGVAPGDEVITAANAGMYATVAIRAAGAVPVYVEIDEPVLTIDPAAVAAALTQRTRAVIATHLYGRMADVATLSRLAADRGIALIEDCAQAHGAQRDGRGAGAAGVLGCYSFYPTKNLGALGDAGAVVTSDSALAARVRELRQYGWRAKYHCETSGGMNSRMDELQAAALLTMLPRLAAWNRRRREIAHLYARSIAHPAITLPPPADEAGDVVHLYVVRVRDRDAFRTHLAAAGVASDVHYPVPDYRQPPFAAQAPAAGLVRTERACAEVVSLPCYPELTDAEIAAVAAACNRWQGRPAIRS